MSKQIELTGQQWDLLMTLKELGGKIWIGVLKKKVVKSLIEKGLAKEVAGWNVVLTKAGKEWKNPKKITK